MEEFEQKGSSFKLTFVLFSRLRSTSVVNVHLDRAFVGTCIGTPEMLLVTFFRYQQDNIVQICYNSHSFLKSKILNWRQKVVLKQQS